jgi:hypothetical protein
MGLRDIGRPMSEESTPADPVELVERAIAALNAREIDAYLACCTDDVELQTPLAPVGGAYKSADGIRRFFADIEDAAPDFQITLQGTEVLDSARVPAFLQTCSTWRVSGISYGAATTNVYDLDAGAIARVRIFLDREQGLEAVGPAE